jgi:hypothetical protein
MLTDICFVSSAQIVLPRVSGVTKLVLAKDAKSMVSRSRVWTACVRPGKSESSAVLTNVKAKGQTLRQHRTQVSSGLPDSMPYLIFPSRFPSYWRGSVGNPTRSTRRCPSRGHASYRASHRATIHATRGILVISILSTSTWIRPAAARRSCKWGRCSTRAAGPPCLLSDASRISPGADVSSASRGVWSYSHPRPGAGH